MEGLKNKIASGLNSGRKQFRFCPFLNLIPRKARNHPCPHHKPGKPSLREYLQKPYPAQYLIQGLRPRGRKPTVIPYKYTFSSF